MTQQALQHRSTVQLLTVPLRKKMHGMSSPSCKLCQFICLCLCWHLKIFTQDLEISTLSHRTRCRVDLCLNVMKNSLQDDISVELFKDYVFSELLLSLYQHVSVQFILCCPKAQIWLVALVCSHVLF